MIELPREKETLKMKNIVFTLIYFIAIILIFVIQNFLFLTSSQLVYQYETISAFELYASLCFLYFSLKLYHEKAQKIFRFLFVKVFSPAILFSVAVLINLDFNKLTFITSCVSFLLIITSLTLITLAVFQKNAAFQEKTYCKSYSSLQILSSREQEVADLILQGKTTQETADALFVSVSTVKTHIQHIYEKTGVRNRAELAQFVQNHPFGR